MDVQQNLILAKKYMVESVFRAANVEGIGVTFPETQAICDGMSIGGHKIEEVEAVVDLKHAWQWCFANLQEQISPDTLQTINRIAGKMTVINAGSLRDRYDTPTYVTLRYGECYAPPLPQADTISKDLSIPPEHKWEFYNCLTDFYGDDACKGALKDFLHQYCFTFSPETSCE